MNAIDQALTTYIKSRTRITMGQEGTQAPEEREQKLRSELAKHLKKAIRKNKRILRVLIGLFAVIFVAILLTLFLDLIELNRFEILFSTFGVGVFGVFSFLFSLYKENAKAQTTLALLSVAKGEELSDILSAMLKG